MVKAHLSGAQLALSELVELGWGGINFGHGAASVGRGQEHTFDQSE